MDVVSREQLGLADENGLHVSFPGIQLDWSDLRDQSPEQRKSRASTFVTESDWDHYFVIAWLLGSNGSQCWETVPEVWVSTL